MEVRCVPHLTDDMTIFYRVTPEKTILLTEYGITRTLFPQDFYFGDDSTVKVLLKWMAPEVIDDFNFSSKSDVVSTSLGK